MSEAVKTEDERATFASRPYPGKSTGMSFIFVLFGSNL